MTQSDRPVDDITVGEVYRVLGRVEKSLEQKVSDEVYQVDKSQIHTDLIEVKRDIKDVKAELQKFSIKIAAAVATFNTAMIFLQWYLISNKGI